EDLVVVDDDPRVLVGDGAGKALPGIPDFPLFPGLRSVCHRIPPSRREIAALSVIKRRGWRRDQFRLPPSGSSLPIRSRTRRMTWTHSSRHQNTANTSPSGNCTMLGKPNRSALSSSPETPCPVIPDGGPSQTGAWARLTQSSPSIRTRLAHSP